MTESPARGRIVLIVLVVLAAVLRIGAIVYTHATAAAPEENRIIARNLADGRGFTFTEFGVTGPTAVRGPAYPMLLAMLGPDRVGLILAVNVIAGMATVLAAFTLTRTLASTPFVTESSDHLAGELARRSPEAEERRASSPAKQNAGRSAGRSPWIAAALFALWPTQVYAATLTQGLSISVLLTLAALALAFRRTPPATIAAGAIAGLAALTEPTLALPLILAALALGWRRRWPCAALYLATGLVVVAPWLYRNSVVFGGPIPITSNFWRDAFLGNGDNSTGSTIIRDRDVLLGLRPAYSRLQALRADEFDRLKTSEPRRIEILRDWTLRWINAHPRDFTRLCVTRAVKTILIDGDDPRLGLHRPFASAVFWTLAIAGYAAARASMWLVLSRPGLSLGRNAIIVVAVGLVLVSVVTVTEPRLLVLTDALLLIAATVSRWPPLRKGVAA